MTRRTPSQYDWDACEFDETILTKHFSPLRSRDIEFVVVHHMTIEGDGDGSALDACYRVWQNRQASAHYGVDGALVRQYVWDKNFAWATGSNRGNLHGISIEHANSSRGPKWLVSELTIRTGAKLAAHLHVRYKLGRPTSNSNGTTGTLRQHEAFTSTACPGPYLGGSQWNAYVKEAQRVYDQITKRPTPKPTPTPKPPVKFVPWYEGSFANLWGDDSGRGTDTYPDRIDELVRDLTKGRPDVVTGCEVREGAQEKLLRREMKAEGYPIGYVEGGNFAFFRAGTAIAYAGTYTLRVQGEGRPEKLLRIRAKVNGHWLHVGVTHLDYRPGAKFDALRVDQAEDVIAAMERFGSRYDLEQPHRWLITGDPNSHAWVRDKAFLPAGFVVAAQDGLDQAYVGASAARPVLASSSAPTASDHPVLRFTIGKKA